MYLHCACGWWRVHVGQERAFKHISQLSQFQWSQGTWSHETTRRVSDPHPGGCWTPCSQHRPCPGLAALRDRSTCCTGSTSYPVPHPSCLSFQHQPVYLLSKLLINEAGVSEGVRDAIGRRGEGEISYRWRDKQESCVRPGGGWAVVPAGGGRSRKRVFPSCHHVSAAPSSPPSARAFITGDAFWCITHGARFGGQAELSREEVSQAQGFPRANLRWFHLKPTKH